MTDQAQNTTVAPQQARQAYEIPTVILVGDVRDVTLGASTGTGDSGNPTLQRF